MHIFDFYDGLKTKKNFNFFLEGEKSLRLLAMFTAGYEAGVRAECKGLTGFEEMRAFNSWVATELHFAESTSGWCKMILAKAGSDEKAFDLFFELLDKYRRERNRQQGSVKK